MVSTDQMLALVPLSLPLFLCIRLIDEPIPILRRWVERLFGNGSEGADVIARKDAFSSQLLAYLIMAALGYAATTRLVPNIQQYTLRKGIAGKDLGKRGTATADKPMCVHRTF